MKTTIIMTALLLGLATCANTEDETPDSSRESCAIGDTEVASSSACLQDCAACYELASGRWCTGGGSCVPRLQYDQQGCLTFFGASALCGADSDGRVCQLAATCRNDADAGQCSIDCEMSMTLGCIRVPDVECVSNATQSNDCAALGGCSAWALVY